jgi:hypothetical protein
VNWPQAGRIADADLDSGSGNIVGDLREGCLNRYTNWSVSEPPNILDHSVNLRL